MSHFRNKFSRRRNKAKKLFPHDHLQNSRPRSKNQNNIREQRFRTGLRLPRTFNRKMDGRSRL